MSLSEQKGGAGGEPSGRNAEDVAADVYDFVNDFLDDQDAGRDRSLTEYLSRYPGAEEEVAAEYLRLTGHTVDAEDSTVADDAGRPKNDDDTRRVAHYRLVRRLGRGGQGEVWLAEDERLGRTVAIKLLTALFVTEERRARFRREAESIARLEHPGLAHVLEADIDSDLPYIAMRYVAGSDLGSSLEQSRERAGSDGPGVDPLVPWIPQSRGDLGLVLRFFERCARALHAAHEAGVIHRDVKPGNIMVTSDGEPVLLDFGLAREEVPGDATALTREGDVFGTLAYMAPEQLRGTTSGLDARADVWALGVTLFEALTGEQPFTGGGPGELAIAIDSGRRRDPRALNANLTTDVHVVLDTALERNPERRYSDALALAEDLRRIREYEPIRARPAGPMLRLRRWCRREPAWAATIAVTFVALVGGLLYALVMVDKLQRAIDERDARIDERDARHYINEVPGLQERAPAGALALGLETVDLLDNWETRSSLFAPLLALTLDQQIELPARRVWDVAYVDEDILVACGNKGAIRVYDRSSRSFTASETLDFVPRTLAVDGPRVLVGGEAGQCRALRIRDLSVEWSATLPGNLVHDLVLADDVVLALVDAATVCAVLRSNGEVVASHASPFGVGALEVDAERRRVVATGRASHGLRATTSTAARVLTLPELEFVADLDHDDALRDVAIARQAGVVFAVDDGGGARCFDVTSGEPLPFAGGRDALDLGASCTAVAVSADGDDLVVGVQDGETYSVVAVSVKREESEVESTVAWTVPTSGRVVDLEIDPSSQRVAIASWDNRIRVVGLDSGEVEFAHAEANRPSDVRWSPVGTTLSSFGIGKSAEIWRTTPNPLAFRFQPISAGPRAPVVWGSFTGDGERVLLLDDAGRAALFDAPRDPSSSVRAGARVARIDPGAASSDAPGPARMATATRAPIATWIGEAGVGRIVDTRTAEILDETTFDWDVVADGPGLRDVAISDDGTCVAVIDPSGGAWVWCAGRDPVAVQDEEGRGRAGFHVATFGQRGDLFLADGAGAVLRLSATDPERRLAFEPAPPADGEAPSRPLDIAVSPSGDEVTLVGERWALGRWDTESGDLVPWLEQTRANRRWIHYLDDDRLLSADRGAWSAHVVTDGEDVWQSIEHDDLISCCAVGPDGTTFATGSNDRSIFVWDAANFVRSSPKEGAVSRSSRVAPPLVRATIHDGPVHWVDADRGAAGIRILSCASDGAAVWPVDVLGVAIQAAPRALQELERAEVTDDR